MRTQEVLRRFNRVTEYALMVTQAAPLDEPGPVILYVNDAFERLTGYSVQDAVGRSPRFLQGPLTQRAALDRIRAAMIDRTRTRVELINYRKDGSSFWNELAIHPLEDAGDGSGFLGVLNDISERKRVEEALLESEARFRAVAELMPAAVLVTRRADGAILYGNPWIAGRFDIPSADLTRRSVLDFYADPKDRDRLLAALSQRDLVTDFEFQARNPDGTLTCALFSARRMQFNGEDAILVVGTDISARKRIETQLRQARRDAERARREAEAAMLARTKFFAAASHDLRQPYQAMRLLVHLMAVRAKDPEMREIVAKLEEAMTAGETLLTALLDISTLESGTIRPQLIDIDIAEFLERVAREFVGQAEAAGLNFSFRSCQATVRTDPMLLHRILSNLLSNALRYTPKGGILLGCRRRGAHVHVEVWDTGVGIAQDKLATIFEDYVQLANPGRNRQLGLGLGLSIVARTARLLDHRIEVRSRPGRGSMFRVELPVTNRRPVPSMPASDTGGIASARNKTVVLVEDDEAILGALLLVLENWGMRPVIAPSLDILSRELASQDEPPSLVIVDYRLREGATGLDAINLVRGHFRQEIPAIVLTGDTRPDRIREIAEEGHTLLHKPLDPEVLRMEIARLLDTESVEGTSS